MHRHLVILVGLFYSFQLTTIILFQVVFIPRLKCDLVIAGCLHTLRQCCIIRKDVQETANNRKKAESSCRLRGVV